MEKIFDGIVPEEELKDLTEVNEAESGGVVITPLCPTSACTSRCGLGK